MKNAHSKVVSELIDDGYSKRKMLRIEAFNKTHGVKKVTCAACSGSGYYDNNGSPKCGSCNGLGKTFPYSF
jgi:hypothetical protein